MLDTAFWGCMLEHRIFLGSKGSVLFDRLQRSHRRGCGHMAYEGKMDYNYQLKIINGMAVEPNTDVRIDCPFCFHGNTFTLKNIDGKIMWNCFYASCNAKGIISKEMSPEELKNFLNGTIKELSAKNKVQLENKIKWNVPNYFTSVHSDNRALNYVKKNNCFNAMQKGLAKIMYDPKQDRVVFLIKEQNKVVGAIGRAITSATYPKWFIYGKKSNPFICGNHREAVLVEDCASACAVSNVITGIALLGTSLSEEYIPYLKKYNRILVALDRDATIKAFDIANRCAILLNDVRVIILEDDLKYYDEDKIQEILK